jgi:hypothetical protein
MNFAPSSTKGGKVCRQLAFYPCDVLTAEPIDFAQAGRPTWAVQDEYSFTACTCYVDVRRAVIVWVDHHP